MIRQEILDGNKLIAKFIGLPFDNEFYLISNVPHIRASCYFQLEALEYHTSWDWLMPVIDECRLLDEDSEHGEPMLKVRLWMFITDDIEMAWKEVVDFIIYYNKKISLRP